MYSQFWHKYLFASFAVLLCMFITACQSSPGEKKVEDELVAFILDSLIFTESTSETGSTNDLGQSWIEYIDGYIDVPSIIIWAPPINSNTPKRSYNTLNTAEPIKVWWFENKGLSEVTNKTEAIEQYRHDYLRNQDSLFWGYYEFGIISISKNGQEAEVYLGILCGRLCGHGTLYTLHCNESGQWEIIDSEWLWIS
jgi:hypothetical protein